MKIRILLIIGISVCFFLAGSRIYDFVGGFVPPAQPGECLQITYAGRASKVKVIANGSNKSIVAYLVNGSKQMINYSELRDLQAKKVNCK